MEGQEERGLLVLYLPKQVCCWQVLGALAQSENVSSLITIWYSSF